MSDIFRIVLFADIEAETAAAAYSTLFDAMMATGLSWETTDEWYNNAGEDRLPQEAIDAARDAHRDRGQDVLQGSEIREIIYRRRFDEDRQLNEVLEEFRKLFEKAPKVLKVRWKQYTQYRNGCDPCEFLVYDPEYEIEGLEDWHEYNGWRPSFEHEFTANAALKPIIPVQLFSFAYREAFQAIFGDHVQVTVDRDLRVVIEDCEHG
jgi:hypothetical protein